MVWREAWGMKEKRWEKLNLQGKPGYQSLSETARRCKQGGRGRDKGWA